MVRIDAKRRVAFMENRKPIRDFPAMQHPRNAMSAAIPAFCAAKPDLSVSSAATACHPKPATGKWLRAPLLIEAFLKWTAMLIHFSQESRRHVAPFFDEITVFGIQLD